ncbi:uncharacterized protein LOC128501165 isoform X2 [Spea bombifrons]|uniref:uncharacterized protein LOC128501165 isoform X2 n=1 Tax=Spea bombifrons TaxID=233779 RepID=UPI00234A92EA|nr:uncharacterized protein LOC128501165 isoform X2 [Spea bombifrons]
MDSSDPQDGRVEETPGAVEGFEMVEMQAEAEAKTNDESDTRRELALVPRAETPLTGSALIGGFRPIIQWIWGFLSCLYQKSRRPTPGTVGILKVPEMADGGWLEDLLTSSEFTEHVADVKRFCVSEEGPRDLDSALSCLVMVQPIGSSDYQRDHLDLMEGKDLTLLQADRADSEETGSPKRRRYEEETPEVGGRLVIFTRDEMKLHKEIPDVLHQTAEKLRAIKETMAAGLESWNFITKYWRGAQKHKVGIFSRSAEEDYKWLNSRLKSALFQDVVESTESCYISNNGGPRFRDAVSRCSFAILYHTKNRGRINVTDVEDSLYDRELQHLHNHLGKEKVIVVIDDLQDSSPHEKNRISENQPSIGRLAAELVLFHKQEKTFWDKAQTIKESTQGKQSAAEQKMADSPV